VAFFNDSGQLLAAPIKQGLTTWSQCAPSTKRVKVHAHGSSILGGPNVEIGTTLANLTDSASTDIASDLLGTITWGDGSTSDAKYKVKITVKDLWTGKTAKGKLKITVT
jgi:hypothetical protein